MPEKIKKGDFIEIEYTGKEKESGLVFDTTSAETAKKNNIFNKNREYEPEIICIGQKQVLPGLDEELEGKEIGKSYSTEIPPEKAFGRKNPKLLKIVSTGIFKKQKIDPVPGLQINIDGIIGMIRTVTGGRVVVDFNHPLSGKEISYDYKINRIVTDEKEIINALLKSAGIKDAETSIEENKAVINLKKELPDEIKKLLTEKLKELTSLKNIEFKITIEK